jgi:thiol-disulfide isomerase/thioredoxin
VKLFSRPEVELAGDSMTKLFLVMLLTLVVAPAFAAENLRLNDHLNYSSDSQDGPLITGDHLEQGAANDRPTYVIIYSEGCFNSKRQARRTVELYEKYKGKVQFAVVDLDKPRSAAQEDLVKRFYKGYIPHVTVLKRDGKIAYNASGEAEQGEISKVLDKTLK